MDLEIVEKNGRLCLKDSWATDFNKPERYRVYWPTGIMASDYPHLVGRMAHYIGGGLYQPADGPAVALENRAETHPDATLTETEPIKRPKWAKSYHNGEWKRY
jgi:hypothetical protein